ncbi:hypothetical protein EROM_050090 [Encephalitozoon romaleae SJ-2008]|uniref:Uncharacterized protein n=1 Tax=Encephalitozoon romaleae (strain SJ-2008) TaxID=1178016 RepID=I6ZI95_ENCRO|nr:hypothetical protein EROM_050090 [Encephalitozoon romaleae SJ-2008]AFN82943.1 hypothetical protein EROM_050090 [Encephalitozoon romaleae SJ-2008]
MESAKGILRVENVEITVEEGVVCRGQRILAVGIYGITGLYNALRDALMASLTVPAATDSNLKFHGRIFFEGNLISYKELQKMMNPFVMFYSCESVQSSLEFVNFSKVKDVMDIFDLDRIKKLPISKLTVSESRRWEAAISAASESKVIVLRDFHATYEATKKYLSFLGECARRNRSIVLVEVDSPLEYDLDGCIIIGKNDFECINFSTEKDLCKYREILFKSFLKGLEVKCDSKKQAKKDDSEVFGSMFLGSPTDTGGHFDVLESIVRPSGKEAGSGIVYYKGTEQARNHVEGFLLKTCDTINHAETTIFEDITVLHNVQGIRPFSNTEQKASATTSRPVCKYFLGYEMKDGMKELLFEWFLSVDIRLSLLLTRRKYFLEEKRPKGFKKFMVSFLMHIYLAIILRFKASVFNDAVSISDIFQGFLEAFRERQTFLSELMGRILAASIRDVIYSMMHAPRASVALAFSTGRMAREIIWRIRVYNWDLVDYKIISTGVYFFIFTKGGTIINEERAQIHSHANRIYSSGTYFFHIFIYLILKSWIPVLLMSYILNFNFVLIFLITGTFTCTLMNLVLNLKLKYLFMCMILAFNLLYPLDQECYQKSFFLRYSESFNFLVACRQFPLACPKEKFMLLCCLLRAFLFIYLFFCYTFSKLYD